MKLSRIFIIVFIFSIVFSAVSAAKTQNGLNMSSPSVQLLKKLNDEGKTKIQNETAFETPDMQADTQRVKALKEKFYQEKRDSFPKVNVKE